MSRLEPGADRPPEAPPVRILGVSVAGIPRGISPFGMRVVPPFEVKPDERQIEIEFSSLSLRTGDRVRFQYRLEGGEGRWSEPIRDRRVNLAGLAPGRYRFEVRGINSDELVSPEPAVVSFRVLPPFWRRGWFVSVVLAAVVAAAYGVHRIRLRRVVELERVRTRIATDLHDDIGSSLSQVSILSEVASQRIDGKEAEAAKPLLAQIAATSRELVDSMGDIVWAINPKRDRAGDLVQRMRRFASDTLTGKGIRLRFESTEGEHGRRLDLELRRQVFLIFKEAVNNAVRHSACTEAEVTFRLSGKRLVLEVRDDGKGFDVEGGSEGHGLSSMRRRADGVGGALDLRSSPGGGTTVRLTVPVGF